MRRAGRPNPAVAPPPRRGRRIVLSLLLFLQACANPGVAPARSGEYVQALARANDFLHAWLCRDPEAGLGLLSARVLKPPAGVDAETYASWLELYMTGLSNPHHQAFEILPGEASTGDTFSFPVILHEYATGMERGDTYSSSIELTEEKGEWRIIRLPRSSDIEP